ncbi:MAG: hypothetical protein LAT68_10380 [Cyclobacteriaceae bacterium]|nr:hypothetical protein [Cyclobacteriaceae bacterium]MCH8516721.1 hypothetical protein [Cyclobacteriaceae bacterium]
MQSVLSKKALKILQEASTPNGILAANSSADNYGRVWARDGIISGITGLIYQDEIIIKAFEQTVRTLGNYQHRSGIIPSNVQVSPQLKVSYGSTAGRVDATLWWTIGLQILVLEHRIDLNEDKKLKEALYSAMDVLEVWEMNANDLIYTPIGGNWADEYITQGFTLYDNVLRYWSLFLFNNIFSSHDLKEKMLRVKDKITLNFSFGTDPMNPMLYHAPSYQKVHHDPQHLFSSISPIGYDTRWDMAANALALLLGFDKKMLSTSIFIRSLSSQYFEGLIPVFHPVIYPQDKEWILLENNFNYSFKNHPYHFHNGGSWLIWCGFLSLAFSVNGDKETARFIRNIYKDKLETENNESSFFEYYNTQNGKPMGVKSLCYSACGWLLMDSENQFKTTSFSKLIS